MSADTFWISYWIVAGAIFIGWVAVAGYWNKIDQGDDNLDIALIAGLGTSVLWGVIVGLSPLWLPYYLGGKFGERKLAKKPQEKVDSES